ncbi:hypothetical protein HYU18_01080 [Candidatus Woesearchaeota archaeon]|nr:hypothetical protein [Candidatus Woesearchaeota archaeon]
MGTIFLAATVVIVFVFTALAVLLWSVTGFLKVGAFDLRFLMLIILALLAKMVFDRVKVVLKEHTD